MKEIKFRIFDRVHKKMYHPGSISEISQKTHELGFSGNKSSDLMRYTGLRDQLLKDIYEGDIFSDGNCIGTVETDNFFVTCFRQKDSIHVMDIIELVADGKVSSDGIIRSIFIIGNIYENSNLLE